MAVYRQTAYFLTLHLCVCAKLEPQQALNCRCRCRCFCRPILTFSGVQSEGAAKEAPILWAPHARLVPASPLLRIQLIPLRLILVIASIAFAHLTTWRTSSSPSKFALINRAKKLKLERRWRREGQSLRLLRLSIVWMISIVCKSNIRSKLQIIFREVCYAAKWQQQQQVELS